MSQQQYEIPIAAKVVGSSASSGDSTSFYDQEPDQRITDTLAEIQDKDNEIMKVEKEINSLKTSLAPIFGEAFMHK